MAWNGTVTYDPTLFYNSVDINRQNLNIEYLQQTLVTDGYPITLPQPVVYNLTRTDFPTVARINNMRQNISALISGFYAPSGLPSIAVNSARKQKFGFTEANALEINMQAIYAMIVSVEQSFRRSGAFTCGDTGALY